MSAPADGALAVECEGDEAPTRRHLPVVAPAERVQRAGQRARTVSLKRFGKRALAEGARLYPTPDVERPVTRADCLAGGINEARPCPWVSCAAHLALDVNEHNGNIKLNFPGAGGEPDLDAMPETCALDVADRGGVTLEELGSIVNLTRERIRQIETLAMERLRDLPITRELAGVEHTDSRGEVAVGEDVSGERTDADAMRGLSELSYGGAALWGMP